MSNVMPNNQGLQQWRIEKAYQEAHRRVCEREGRTNVPATSLAVAQEATNVMAEMQRSIAAKKAAAIMAIPHASTCDPEHVRAWLAPGGGCAVAVRDRQHDNDWRIEAGPRNLIGRHYRHISDARAAVKSAGRDAVKQAPRG